MSIIRKEPILIGLYQIQIFGFTWQGTDLGLPHPPLKNSAKFSNKEQNNT